MHAEGRWFQLLTLLLLLWRSDGAGSSNAPGLLSGVVVSTIAAGVLLVLLVGALLILLGYCKGPAAFGFHRLRLQEESLLAQRWAAAGDLGNALPGSWKRRRTPGFVGDEHDDDQSILKEVTISITDVEGSTELWEWNEAVMTEAQDIHDHIQRTLISHYCGHEVTTEGDSFTVAFHDALDAAAWALHLQFAMLHAAWPEELLHHEKGKVVHATARDGSRPGQLLFRGLRIRVAVNTGIPSRVHRHDITQELQYQGQVMDLVAAISDLPAGGQMLLGPQSISRLANRLTELGRMLPPSVLANSGGSGGVHGGANGIGAAANGTTSAEHLRPSRSMLHHIGSIRGQTDVSAAAAAVVASASAVAMLDPGIHRGGEAQLVGMRPWPPFSLSAVTRPALKFSLSDIGSRSSSFFRSASTTGTSFFRGGVNRFLTSSIYNTRDEGAGPYPDDEVALQPHRTASVIQLASHVKMLTEDLEDVPLLIDMGAHWLEGIVPAPADHMPATRVGTRLTQLLSKCLVPRASYFPNLVTSKQVSLSFFDAPHSRESLLPEGTWFRNHQFPEVCILFTSPAQLKVLEATDLRMAKLALASFNACIRLTLHSCRGYECMEKDGIFMIAFVDAPAALEWSTLLQLALLRVRWAPELLATPVGAEVLGEDGTLLFRGLRARVGLFHGSITRLIPHRTTGRADYFGPPVNRAARFLAAAAGGQILAERSAVDAIVARWREREAAMLATMGEAQRRPSESITPPRRVAPTRSRIPRRSSMRSAGGVSFGVSYSSNIGSDHHPMAISAAAAVAAALATYHGADRLSRSTGGGPGTARCSPGDTSHGSAGPLPWGTNAALSSSDTNRGASCTSCGSNPNHPHWGAPHQHHPGFASAPPSPPPPPPPHEQGGATPAYAPQRSGGRTRHHSLDCPSDAPGPPPPPMSRQQSRTHHHLWRVPSLKLDGLSRQPWPQQQQQQQSTEPAGAWPSGQQQMHQHQQLLQAQQRLQQRDGSMERKHGMPWEMAQVSQELGRGASGDSGTGHDSGTSCDGSAAGSSHRPHSSPSSVASSPMLRRPFITLDSGGAFGSFGSFDSFRTGGNSSANGSLPPGGSSGDGSGSSQFGTRPRSVARQTSLSTSPSGRHMLRLPSRLATVASPRRDRRDEEEEFVERLTRGSSSPQVLKDAMLAAAEANDLNVVQRSSQSSAAMVMMAPSGVRFAGAAAEANSFRLPRLQLALLNHSTDPLSATYGHHHQDPGSGGSGGGGSSGSSAQQYLRIRSLGRSPLASPRNDRWGGQVPLGMELGRGSSSTSEDEGLVRSPPSFPGADSNQLLQVEMDGLGPLVEERSRSSRVTGSEARSSTAVLPSPFSSTAQLPLPPAPPGDSASAYDAFFSPPTASSLISGTSFPTLEVYNDGRPSTRPPNVPPLQLPPQPPQPLVRGGGSQPVSFTSLGTSGVVLANDAGDGDDTARRNSVPLRGAQGGRTPRTARRPAVPLHSTLHLADMANPDLLHGVLHGGGAGGGGSTYLPEVLMPVVVGAPPLSYQQQRRTMLFASAASAAVVAMAAGFAAGYAQEAAAAQGGGLYPQRSGLSLPPPTTHLDNTSSTVGASSATSSSQVFVTQQTGGISPALQDGHRHSPVAHSNPSSTTERGGGGVVGGEWRNANSTATWGGGSPHGSGGVSRGAANGGSWNYIHESEQHRTPEILLSRRRFDHVPLQIQVHDFGQWSFKGIGHLYACCQIVPSCLQGRVPLMAAISSPKARLASPGTEGLLHEVHISVINLGNIMADSDSGPR